MVIKIQTKKTRTSAKSNYSAKQKLKTSKYEKTESVLLEWFRQKWVLYTPIQGPTLRQKAEEITLRLNTEFTPLNG
jgi:hypothetical protein